MQRLFSQAEFMVERGRSSPEAHVSVRIHLDARLSGAKTNSRIPGSSLFGLVPNNSSRPLPIIAGSERAVILRVSHIMKTDRLRSLPGPTLPKRVFPKCFWGPPKVIITRSSPYQARGRH